MTPEEAEKIYHQACVVEYRKFCNDYKPVNQRKVALSGFQAVIDAVKAEVIKQNDTDWAERYLALSQSLKAVEMADFSISQAIQCR